MSQYQKSKFLTENKPQLIVLLKQAVGNGKSKSIDGSDDLGQEQQLHSLLKDHDVKVSPVFPASLKNKSISDKSIAEETGNKNLQYMERMFAIHGARLNLEKIKSDLQQKDLVEAAYFKPASEPPFYYQGRQHAGSLKAAGLAKNITDNLSAHQTYLDAAPRGIDARFAWTVAGGRGTGVTIIDVEGGWNFQHEDLNANSQGLVSGFNYTGEPAWYQHGTAVLGEMGGDANAMGVTGICPEASLSAVSVFEDSDLNWNTANAIMNAADNLQAGDILLIEQHRPGPNTPRPDDNSQFGYLALEWWPDDFLAIQYATSRGIIVIEAAGNGSQELNDPVYDVPFNDFPDWWSNPFNRGEGMDSGAIIVGAGAPPPGTNGGHWGTERSRLGFSNYGTCVDAQAWGEGVTTCGYGDIHGQDPNNMSEWYTDFFAGTSSASPIVTGAVACLQGIRRAAQRAVLTPAEVRNLLRSTGSPQQAGANVPVSQRIGNLPDLRSLINRI